MVFLLRIKGILRSEEKVLSLCGIFIVCSVNGSCKMNYFGRRGESKCSILGADIFFWNFSWFPFETCFQRIDSRRVPLLEWSSDHSPMIFPPFADKWCHPFTNCPVFHSSKTQQIVLASFILFWDQSILKISFVKVLVVSSSWPTIPV